MNEKTEGGGWKVPPPQLYFNPFQIQSWLTLLVLGPIFVDGCIRRSLFQPQTTTTTTTSTTSTTSTAASTASTTSNVRPMTMSAIDDTTIATTLVPSHKQACLPDEVHSTNCLHGGTCYVVILNNNRQSFCHCTEEWTGKRCEQYFIDPGILASMEQNMRTANIAAGVSVCILVLFVLLFASYVYLRYKRRRKRHLANRECEASADDEHQLSKHLSCKQYPLGEGHSVTRMSHISEGTEDPDGATEFDLNRNDRHPRENRCQAQSGMKSTSL